MPVLSADELSQAFLLLDGQREMSELPESLARLDPGEWTLLVELLSRVMEERRAASVH